MTAATRTLSDNPVLAGGLAAAATVAVALLLTTFATPALQPAASDPKLPQAAAQFAGPANPYLYSDVAERAVKSVVSITTSKLLRGSSSGGRMHRYHRFRGLPPHGREMPRGFRQGSGSGVIVGAQGLILTNNHVIAGADKIRVQLADRRTFTAEIVGTDPKTDVAVLKLQGKVGKLPVLPFADSDKVRLGEVVLAIGNSFGRLHHTVTQGIVSAKGRGNVGIVDYEDFIQTDAAINPGNSGGALVNMRGELVGVPTAIASRSGGSQGVGFAIPANMAKRVMGAIVDGGGLDRGYLGVVIQDMTDGMARAFGTGGKRGVLIGDVQPGSPAAKAGIKRGDVVLAIDGKHVERTARLRNIVALAGSGAKIKLNLIRDGKTREITVTLGSAPGQRVARRGGKDKGDKRLGLALAPLSDRARQRFGLSRNIKRGALVTRVVPGSHASSAGLEPGDIIVEVGRKPVKDVGDAIDRLKGAKGTILVTVRRGEHLMYRAIRAR